MEKNAQKIWGVVGCGWLGLSLAENLTQLGFEVHGSTRSEEKADEISISGLQMHVYNASDRNSEAEWLSDIDLLVINIPPSSMDEYTEDLLSIVRKINDKCNVIFVSSTSVYPNTNSTVNESTVTSGTNRNGPIVSEAERALLQYLSNRLTILRMSGLVGGERNPVTYMSGKEISGGKDPVNLVHRDDCIGVILRVSEKESWGEIYNVCCSDHPTKREYYEHAAEKHQVPAPMFEENSTKFKIIDNEHLKRSLDYEYKYDSPFEFP
tara:strand:+ start:141720 stop:142517 length:798 start_codon:yes stop_codon:yes gene_type:complete